MHGHPVPAVLATGMLVAALACPRPDTVAAQTNVTIEVGASQIGPPLGLDSESARFGVAGLRASHYALGGSGVSLSVLAGRAFGDPTGGDFATASLSGTVAERWTAHWGGAFDVSFLAFGVRAPFPYRAVAVEGGPALTFDAGPMSLKLSALAGAGRSRVELWRVEGGTTRVFHDDLWRVGSTAEVLFGTGPIRAGAAAGLHKTPGGSYASGGARLLVAGPWGAAELSADVWRTPLDTEPIAALVLVIPMSGWHLRGFIGRSEPDPLTLAEPGSGSGGVLVGLSLLSRGSGSGAGVLPYRIVSQRARGARIRVTVEVPEGTGAVELLGDFSLWEPLPMQLKNGRWETELEVEVGTHHYGFLVDDEWYVPDEARDVVPDEWGRVSAILVIEGVD